jgi:hypothetical protein
VDCLCSISDWCIVLYHLLPLQGKARLGAIVHQKNAAALALTAVKNEDQREFSKLVDSFKSQFNEGARVQVRLHSYLGFQAGLCRSIFVRLWHALM